MVCTIPMTSWIRTPKTTNGERTLCTCGPQTPFWESVFRNGTRSISLYNKKEKKEAKTAGEEKANLKQISCKQTS
jgi:hypothetical protein